MIIQDINTTKTFIVEFLHRSKQHWCARRETGPKATSINPVCIEESKEDKAKEHYFDGGINSEEKHKEGECCYAGRIYIHRIVVEHTTSHKGADNGRITTKVNGDGIV
jgi:hypothetical protein